MNNGFRDQQLNILQQVFREISSIQLAILFGSHAKVCFRKGSDVDIAIKGCTYEEIIELSMKLNEETPLPFFFDIVAYETLESQEIIDRINRVGKILYQKNAK